MINSNIILYSALNGKAESQFIMGENYYYGKSVERDYNLAFYWYEQASRHGHVRATYMIASMLLKGLGCKVDLQRANKLLKKSSRANDIQAILQLAYNNYYGLGMSTNSKTAFKLWKKGAKLSSPEAEYYLGLCYGKGIYVKQDLLKGKKHLYNALNMGFDLAKLTIREIDRYTA